MADANSQKPDIPCFLLNYTGRTRRRLRRYRYYTAGRDSVQLQHQSLCPLEKGAYGGHNAFADFDEVVGPGDDKLPPRDDPRWPKSCGCGYVFVDEDNWQLFTDSVWVVASVVPHQNQKQVVGTQMTLHDAPVGAMWLADWLLGKGGKEHEEKRKGEPALMLRTPGGDWNIDGRSSNNEGIGWSRTGAPPLVVAKPSIQCNSYHGWLGGPQANRPGILAEV